MFLHILDRFPSHFLRFSPITGQLKKHVPDRPTDPRKDPRTEGRTDLKIPPLIFQAISLRPIDARSFFTTLKAS